VDLPVLVIVIVGLAFVTLVAIIVAPSRRVRAERRLPSDVETRVLLGESPREIDESMKPREDATPEHSPPAAS
jgi:hypothetical protein